MIINHFSGCLGAVYISVIKGAHLTSTNMGGGKKVSMSQYCVCEAVFISSWNWTIYMKLMYKNQIIVAYIIFSVMLPVNIG